jgi:thiosulfate/3-mercaptopyruvate sulfurtransferase
MNPLVSPRWLAERLHDPGVIVLDATLPPVGVSPPIDVHARYLAKHIPGALFFNIEELSDHSTPLPHMLPAPEDFSRSMSALGISDQMAIVVHEQEGVFSAPRAWWMLRTFGAEHVYLLDGGLRAWIEDNFPTDKGRVDRVPATRRSREFHAKLDENVLRSFGQINQLIADRAQILDARSSGRFTGALPEPRPGLSSGHMPGAISTPYTELLEGGRFKPVLKLREYFTAKGVNIEQPITTTCGSGVTAAVVLLGLTMAGAEQVSLYDGSWAEYAQHPEGVIRKDV